MSEAHTISGASHTFACGRCAKEFDVDLPKLEVIEAETASMLLWAHPDPFVCPYCGQGHQMAVAKLDGFAIVLKPVKTAQASRILTPPAGLIVPGA